MRIITAWNSNVFRLYLTGDGASEYFTIKDTWTNDIDYFIIITKSGSEWISYIDGVEQYRYTSSVSSLTFDTIGNKLSTDAQYNMNGEIRDLVTFDIELSPERVTELYERFKS